MAIVDFTNETYIDTVWFLAWDQTDWMATIFKDTAESPWRLTYRFRYYDPSGDDDKDKKSPYQLRAKDGSEDSLRRLHDATNLIVGMTEKQFALKVNACVPVKGDAHAYYAALEKQPWARATTYVPVAAPSQVQ
jgi:hypothetical protein